MDSSDISEKSIGSFLRKIFTGDPNYGSLTKAALQGRYLEEKGLSGFSIDEKKLFSSVVNEIIEEFSEPTPKKSKVSRLSREKSDSPKKGTTLKKRKIYSSDDESDSDLSENELNKENVKSVNEETATKNRSHDRSSEESDSDAAQAASESETGLSQEKQIENIKSADIQQDDDEENQSKGSSSDDDDFVSKDNQAKNSLTETQLLNSSHSDLDAKNSGSEISSNDSISDEKKTSKKRKSSVQENEEKPNKRQKLSSKKTIASDSSDDDAFVSKMGVESKTKNKLSSSKQKTNKKVLNPKKQKEHDSSVDSEGEEEFQKEKTKGKTKKSKNGEAPRKSKSPPTNGRIEHLKKYLRAAGLRIASYDKLFMSCRSQKAKVEKLLEVLENAGMKGRPTLEKCKKLKKKIEEKKDIESLDLSNIIKTEGRPKRNTHSLYFNSQAPVAKETELTPVEDFSSSKDILDSDESDKPARGFSRVKNAIHDDDDDSSS